MSASFEELTVWVRSKAVAVQVCQIVANCRSRSFADQVVRSAISVPSNIAEGAERNSRAEFVQFLGYARGSAGELRTQVMIGGELGYIDPMIPIILSVN